MMRFRVSHLLLLTACFSLSVFAFATASDLAAQMTTFATWIVFVAIACRALYRPSERRVLCSALIVGLSFLWCSSQSQQWFPDIVYNRLVYASEGLDYDHPSIPIVLTEEAHNRLLMAPSVTSLVLALIGGALGAYWSRDGKKE
jgi:hypothetical protein